MRVKETKPLVYYVRYTLRADIHMNVSKKFSGKM